MKNLGGVPVLRFLQRLALDFPYICLQFSRDFLTDKCIEKFEKCFQVVQYMYRPQIFSGESLGVKLQFTNHIFFRTAVLRKLFDIRFSYKHCNFSRVCLLVKMASKTVTRSIALAFSLCVSVPASSLLLFHYYRFFSIALLSHFLWQTLLQFFRHKDFFICCCLMADVFLLVCCYGLSRRHFNLFVFPASKVLLFLCSLMADVIHCIFITFYTTEKKNIYIYLFVLWHEKLVSQFVA